MSEGDESRERAVYWTEEEVKTGKWHLAPNLRMMRFLKNINDGSQSGKAVYLGVSTNPKSCGFMLLCPHGECGSSISQFLFKESKALKDGLPLPERHSECTCQNVDGVCPRDPRKYALGCGLTEDDLQPPAKSLYEFLEVLGTHEVTICGRQYRHIPHTSGKESVYLSRKGTYCCRHGVTLASLCPTRVQKRPRAANCDCSPHQPYKRVYNLPLIPQKDGQ